MFATWTDRALALYAECGLVDAPDGGVELACPPAVEADLFDGLVDCDLGDHPERLALPMRFLWAEAGNQPRAHFEGIAAALPDADVESIDALLRSSGFKMGPFQLMDLIGVDTNFSVTESMFRAFYEDGKFRPSRIQKQKVDAGHHGRKSGKGFYSYE